MRWGGLQVTAVGKCILECIYMTLYTWGTLGRDDSQGYCKLGYCFKCKL